MDGARDTSFPVQENSSVTLVDGTVVLFGLHLTEERHALFRLVDGIWSEEPINDSPKIQGHWDLVTIGSSLFIIGFSDQNLSIYLIDFSGFRSSYLSLPSATPLQWIEIQIKICGLPPTDRTGHSCTRTDSNKIFIYGGQTREGIVLDDCYYFSPETQELEKIESSGLPLSSHHSATLVNGMVFIFGGFNGYAYTNQITTFDPDSNIARLFAIQVKCRLPAPRAKHCCITLPNDEVLIYGGNAGEASFRDCWLLKNEPKTWHCCVLPASVAPSLRTGSSLYFDGIDKVVLLGGTTDNGDPVPDPYREIPLDVLHSCAALLAPTNVFQRSRSPDPRPSDTQHERERVLMHSNSHGTLDVQLTKTISSPLSSTRRERGESPNSSSSNDLQNSSLSFDQKITLALKKLQHAQNQNHALKVELDHLRANPNPEPSPVALEILVLLQKQRAEQLIELNKVQNKIAEIDRQIVEKIAELAPQSDPKRKRLLKTTTKTQLAKNEVKETKEPATLESNSRPSSAREAFGSKVGLTKFFDEKSKIKRGTVDTDVSVPTEGEPKDPEISVVSNEEDPGGWGDMRVLKRKSSRRFKGNVVSTKSEVSISEKKEDSPAERRKNSKEADKKKNEEKKVEEKEKKREAKEKEKKFGSMGKSKKASVKSSTKLSSMFGDVPDKPSWVPVPSLVIVDLFLDYLFNHLETEGIFRIPGSWSVVDRIYASLEHPETISLEDEEINVHDVAGTLKQYFRCFQNPLIPYEIFDEAMDLSSEVLTKNDNVKPLRTFLKMKLPADNYLILKRLMGFLQLITTESEINLMDAENLGIVFGPTLIRQRPEDETPTSALTYSRRAANLVVSMISLFNEVFE